MDSCAKPPSYWKREGHLRSLPFSVGPRPDFSAVGFDPAFGYCEAEAGALGAVGVFALVLAAAVLYIAYAWRFVASLANEVIKSNFFAKWRCR